MNDNTDNPWHSFISPPHLMKLLPPHLFFCVLCASIVFRSNVLMTSLLSGACCVFLRISSLNSCVCARSLMMSVIGRGVGK